MDTQEEDSATTMTEDMVTNVSMTKETIQDETLHLPKMQCLRIL